MEEQFCTTDGQLIKNSIVEAALSLQPKLIKLLLDNEELSANFFSDVEGVKVFDKVKFQRFVMNKSFLADSYTAYKNKIGLTDEDGRFLSESCEVVLSWPYKDCMLEGGQTKEDVKRDEIFWSETLAPDEITRLTEPKAFTGFKRYDKDGEHKVENLLLTDNIIIKGNNLLALYSLREKYKGRIKLIYIDPPYYFKKTTATDQFKYNSNFHLSTWLTFLKDRLSVAKSLLCTGGTIWISISEDGMHYLKLVADSIFDKDCFVGTIPRRTRSGKSDVPFNFSQDFDWLLVYTNVGEDVDVMGRNVERTYYESDDYPGQPWRLADLTKQTTAKERPNSFFTMIDPKTGKEYPASEKRTWNVSKDTFREYYDRGEIIFPDDYDFLNITKPYARKFKKDDDKKGKLSSIISDFQIQGFLKALLYDCKNEKGNDEIDNLFGRDEFDYAKPEELVKTIIEATTQEGDIVMDFFSGSGTTIAVAHKMNRQYIGVEQMDYINTLDIPRLKDVINGEQGGISKSINWQGGGSFVYCELAKANGEFVEKIQAATTTEALKSIWTKMKETGYLNYKINIATIDANAADFEALSLDDQKRFLIECLDKNLLYIPFSDIDSEEYAISDEDKRLTKEFYKKN
jgi:adenine-specific DNA-methyltransferase